MSTWQWLGIAAVIAVPQIVLSLPLIRSLTQRAKQIDRIGKQLDAIAEGIGSIVAELDRQNTALEAISESARLAAGRLDGDGSHRDGMSALPPSKNAVPYLSVEWSDTGEAQASTEWLEIPAAESSTAPEINRT